MKKLIAIIFCSILLSGCYVDGGYNGYHEHGYYGNHFHGYHSYDNGYSRY